jgi:hypothetical protein
VCTVERWKEALDISLCAHGSLSASRRDPIALVGCRCQHLVTRHAAIAPLVHVGAKAMTCHFSCGFTLNARRSTAGAMCGQQIIRVHRRYTGDPTEDSRFLATVGTIVV